MAANHVQLLSSRTDNSLVGAGNYIFIYYRQKSRGQNWMPIANVLYTDFFCTDYISGCVLFSREARSLAGSFFLGLDFISASGFFISSGKGIPADALSNSDRTDTDSCFNHFCFALLAWYLYGKNQSIGTIGIHAAIYDYYSEV